MSRYVIWSIPDVFWNRTGDVIFKESDEKIDFKKAKRIFLLDGLQDPGNIGTIIRTSLAFGFDGVMLSSDSVDLYNDKLLRACQGANYYLPVMQKDILESIQLLQDNGFKVYATSLRNAKNNCIIHNTILRKAAERAYVHPLYIESLSNQIISSSASGAIEILNEIYNSGNEPLQILTNLKLQFYQKLPKIIPVWFFRTI